MAAYKAPVRDFRFLMNEVLDYPAHYKTIPSGKDADPETVDAIIEECARISEDVLAPLNQSGDAEGCTFKDGIVTTPKGFKEAYKQYCDMGWVGLSSPEEFGGQGMPASLALVKAEMNGSANWAFSMYPGLSLGAMNTIMQYAVEPERTQYMTKLTDGIWSGTMCLTEPQCGTDLGQVKTKADPIGDNKYKINGTKIFISAGQHDMAENIVHVVLARLPDAPEGTRGISLFVVPREKVNADSSLGEFNNVNCASIEHKMGIHGNATAVLNFDDAEGFLIGEPNKGLEAMFTFMNTARIGTAIQGVAHAEQSFQGSLAYAKDRRSMRALTGKKEPDKPADALIHHPDVRRMLLIQKSVAEGGRAMIMYGAQIADHMFEAGAVGDNEGYKEWENKLGFFTPVLKGFLTELGFEAANHGMQVFGGHGYIGEYGMEQIVRDARISTLYEGTTGIQALDLLGRKVLIQTRGKAVRDFTAEMARFAISNVKDSRMRPFATKLTGLAAQWNMITMRILVAAVKDRDMVGSAATNFMMYSGYVTMGYFWARMAAVAYDKLDNGGPESKEFYQAKIDTAEFYFAHMLPRTKAHAASILKPSKSLMQMPVESFIVD
jgi:alkylation response protein AidB-like acyl-CoA dehydrogenase